MKSAIPILRSFDQRKAQEFYLDYLGFTLDWEFRFEENFPLYMQISRGSCLLHISEHHGDCTPGAHIRIEHPDIDNFVKALQAKPYKSLNPGTPTLQPWGLREITLTDPFGNRITFYSEPSSD